MTKVFSADERGAWAKLQRARPLVEWHKASLRGADFLGDGSATQVMVGTDDEGAGWIGIVHPGRESSFNPAVFAVAARISLSFERLDSREAWLHEGRFPLAGCRPKRGMQMLRVVDQVSGIATLYYWNAEGRRIDAWTPGPRAEPEPWADESVTG